MFQTATLLDRPLVAPKYGSVLVPAGLTRESDALVRGAVEFANRVGAHLLGVSCDETAATAVEREAARLVVEGCEQRFMELSAPVRAGRTWRRSEGRIETALVEFGWAADLIMVGAGVFGGGSAGGAPLRRLLESTGSPVLACPQGCRGIRFDRVAVVCDGSDACRRALRCAMPVIARSARVTLLAADRSADALRRGLSTRGWAEPRVEVVRPATSTHVADRVAELRPDLVILGGWSEMFGVWPARSTTERLLLRGETPLLIAA